MSKKCSVITIAVMTVLLITGAAHAETEGKYSHLFLKSSFGTRYTPPGFGETMEMHYRYYYSDSDSILWKNNHIGAGIVDSISPATNEVGAFIEIEPIAVFKLRAEYLYKTFFGDFTALLPFTSEDDYYSESVLEDRQDDDEAIWQHGHIYKIKPTFQVQYKRFILLNNASFEWYDIDTDWLDKDWSDEAWSEGDWKDNGDWSNYFYEPVNDTLMKTEDYLFLNSTIIGMEVWKKNDRKRIIAGSRYSFFRVDSTETERHQLDGVIVWMMGKKLAFMENPLLMCAVGGYLEDKYHEKDAFGGLIFEFEYSLMKGK